MALEIIGIPALSDNYIYLLHEPAENCTAVIDPAEAQPVLEVLAERGWQLTHILNTHHHMDHTGGNAELKRATNAVVYGYGADAARIPAIDHHLKAGESVQLGNTEAKILFIPGHTSGHIAFYFAADEALFCGDTLFSMGCGRLFEGTPAEMHDSLQQLCGLSPQTQLYCGHEYTQSNGDFALSLEPDNPALQQRMEQVRRLRRQQLPTVPSTLAQERATNPFLRTDSAEIRGNLQMTDASAVEVFAEIRRRKDHF